MLPWDVASEIIPGLYLSSIGPLSNPTLLRKLNIRAILSVISTRPDYSQLDPTIVTYCIEVDDLIGVDLLTSFPTTNRLIADWRSEERNVLVHCQIGASRSATIVAAYLMETLNFGATEALDLLYRQRPVSNPNPGFLEQLQLFEQLNYRLDQADPWYCRYLWRVILSEVLSNHALPPERMEQLKKHQASTSTNSPANSLVKCKHCRRILFTSAQILHQDRGSLYPYLVDWMAKYCDSTEGKINCPGCERKLGKYKFWAVPVASFDINSGAKFKVPLVFNVTKSTVDLSTK